MFVPAANCQDKEEEQLANDVICGGGHLIQTIQADLPGLENL